MIRTVLAAAGVLVAAAAPAASAPAASAPARSAPAAVASAVVVTYVAPVPLPLTVLRRFDPPVIRYGPGHLGVDLRLPAGAVVGAAADGVVRFAGPVAGRGVVVIAHPDGVSTEYEPVRPLVRVGAALARGQPVGQLIGRHRGCRESCLHWGARRAGVYLDPLLLLRPLGPVRLLPWSPTSAGSS
ncbi:MAG TPA: peptidoglycan DD-metalloendopeptidase family protein [Jatrophihabitans sp.]|nr:peptidoglycan DD-metalloendopeptidase family protein [Jatrophihabitans sp.]